MRVPCSGDSRPPPPRPPSPNRTATVVAVKDIRQGEEVCIDYIGAKRLRWSAPTRRRRLLREYLFECACPLCSGAVP